MSLKASTFGRPNAGSVTGWDQFETNRQKFQVRDSMPWCSSRSLPRPACMPFKPIVRPRVATALASPHALYSQVKSTWDENLYTTKLDKSKAGISVAEAERIAADIERQATRNRHMAEERNIRDNTVQEVGASRGCALSKSEQGWAITLHVHKYMSRDKHSSGLPDHVPTLLSFLEVIMHSRKTHLLLGGIWTWGHGIFPMSSRWHSGLLSLLEPAKAPSKLPILIGGASRAKLLRLSALS